MVEQMHQRWRCARLGWPNALARTAAAAFALGLLVGCTVSPEPTKLPTPTTAATASSSASVGLIADSANGFSFDRPLNWQRWQPNQHDPATSGPLLYLSTDDLLPNCAAAPGASPNPPDGQGYACTWPLRELERDSVLVVVYTTRILVPLPTSGGNQIHVNGASAQLQIAKPGGCGAIGADETLDVMLPIGQPTPLSNIGLMACLRGPNLALSEAQVGAMLASLKLAP